MSAPAQYYVGKVSHRRFGDVSHFLRYRIAYVLLDLDRLDEARGLTRFLKIGKGGLMSVNPLDHGDGQSRDLGQSSSHQGRPSIGAHPHAVRHAHRDSHHVLESSADLNTDHVLARVTAKPRAGERGLDRDRIGDLATGDGHYSWALLSDFPSEGRT